MRISFIFADIPVTPWLWPLSPDIIEQHDSSRNHGEIDIVSHLHNFWGNSY